MIFINHGVESVPYYEVALQGRRLVSPDYRVDGLVSPDYRVDGW